MSVDELQTYQEVLVHLKKTGRTKHLLMGNGFSMAYDKDIFSYNALSTFIEDSSNELLKKLFDTINTKNFEEIMQQLDNLFILASVFDADATFLAKIEDARSSLKKSLIEAVESMHPEHVFTIPEDKSKACFTFLEEYLSSNGMVFSSNYDLLLYWVLMRNESESAKDGFGREVENPRGHGDNDPDWEAQLSDTLTWGAHRSTQNIFYLHGALPLFDDGVDIVKEQYTECNGRYILENIKTRMSNKEYPIFVTAGNAREKMAHITHNKYLTFCYDKLCSISGSLITLGFCFGDNDTHIIDAINKAYTQSQSSNVPYEDKFWSVYIGVYSDEDLQHIEAIKSKFKCKVNLYNAKTVNVWGE
jgi:hypothetical protein